MKKRNLLTAIFLLLVTLAQAQPNEKDDLLKQRDEIKKELGDLQKQLNQIKGSKQKSLAELRFIQDKMYARQRLIDNINREVNYIDRDMTKTQRDINKLNARLDTLKQAYAKSILHAWKNRNNYDFLTFIFSANSFNEALKRIEYLKSYRDYRARQADDIRRYKEYLMGKKKELDVKKTEKSNALQNQNVEMKELAGEKNELDETVNQLTSKERNIGGLIAKIKKKQTRIQSQIAAIVKREEIARRKAIEEEKKRQKALEDARRREELAKNKPNPAPDTKTGTVSTPKTNPAPKPTTKKEEADFSLAPAEATLNSQFEQNRGALPWPIEKGYISMHYGNVDIGGVKFNNQSVTFETQQPGATVKAVFNGEVSGVSDDDDGTKTVFVRHGRYISTYSNLSSVSVQRGQSITTGQQIGRTAASIEGNGRGQLEFMMTKGSSIINPEGWIRSR
ncbi:MAG: peptidoglycan DD-metalloendopeptidase family protein [Dinghuibacter sp.]|nr:peptidoglycan DD-metalloendopeptidase family protein [Dinghuibacter sp.]